MGLSCGLLGLPNVGKSTLFNALSGKVAAEAANYPFCTIEPNKGRVAVLDDRLQKLTTLSVSKSTVPSYVDITDIAGLVKGASQGEGLGNQFLGHVREVDALLHVVRCFEDKDITHVSDKVDPLNDVETIETELLLADLQSLEKRLPALEKKVRHVQKELKPLLDVVKKAHEFVSNGTPLRNASFTKDERPLLKELQMLTAKPVLYVLNVSDQDLATGSDLSRAFQKAHPKALTLVMSAAIEAEIAALSPDEQSSFLQDLGLQDSGLSRLAKAAYQLLNLSTFFTTGPQETHAWSFVQGIGAPAAAGLIHTDFERGFIAAEVMSFEDFVQAGSEAAAKAAGKVRIVGKDYVMQDGDVVHFRFNV
ncbi:MAG: redox-regulated ATPase YchF [Holosporaceae bacterium]